MTRLLIAAVCILLGLTREADAAEESLVDYFIRQNPSIVRERNESVTRMDIDITGDGQPELFLALGARSEFWYIFRKTGDRTYRLMAAFPFSWRRFRVDADPPQLVYEWLDMPAGWVRVVLRPAGNGLAVCKECSGEGEDWDAWRKRSELRVSRCGLVEFRQAAPPWKEAGTRLPASGIGGLKGAVVVDGPTVEGEIYFAP